jgi:hypothetical protein
MPSYMGRGNEDLGWRVPMLFAAIGVATFIVYAIWPSFAAICPAGEKLSLCAREWINAASGYIAALLATVAIIFQIRQNEAHRFKALQRENSLAADTLVIDLLEGLSRVQSLARVGDLDPPIAELSRRMTPDAVKVSPFLAIALHKLSGEIAELERMARASFAIAGQLLPPTPEVRRLVAFRMHVLSYCFGIASTQIERTGKAERPFISRTQIDDLQNRYRAQPDDLEYLQNLVENSGSS